MAIRRIRQSTKVSKRHRVRLEHNKKRKTQIKTSRHFIQLSLAAQSIAQQKKRTKRNWCKAKCSSPFHPSRYHHHKKRKKFFLSLCSALALALLANFEGQSRCHYTSALLQSLKLGKGRRAVICNEQRKVVPEVGTSMIIQFSLNVKLHHHNLECIRALKTSSSTGSRLITEQSS